MARLFCTYFVPIQILQFQSTDRRDWNFLGGGGFCKTEELYWHFQRGGGMDIFWNNTTIFMNN